MVNWTFTTPHSDTIFEKDGSRFSPVSSRSSDPPLHPHTPSETIAHSLLRSFPSPLWQTSNILDVSHHSPLCRPCPRRPSRFSLSHPRVTSPSLGFWHQPILSSSGFYRPLPPRLPPLSTPDPGPLHLEDFLLLMMFLFGHRLRSEDVDFNGTLTTSTSPKTDCVGRENPLLPGVPFLSTLPDTM